MIVIVSIAITSCGPGFTTEQPKTDSTTIVVDSTKVVDTVKVK